MACRGMFFALTREEDAKLLAAGDDDGVISIVTEELCSRGDEEWSAGMDKSWDAIHRCLGDGTLSSRQPGVPAKAVLGGRQLCRGSHWIVSHLTAEEVAAVSQAIASMDKATFRQRYFGLKRKFLCFHFSDYEGPIGEDDFEYSWSYFEDMRAFYDKAASAKRSMIFEVDQ
jgi:Domain of unknown function (DUF1877)